MKTWRFAFSRRWFGYLGMAIVFAIACVLLSNWQFARKAEAKAANDLISTNYAKKAEPVADVLPSLGHYDANQDWTPLSLTGTYLTSDLILARDRTYNGNPGFEVLIPLKLTDGDVFIVDRGWVPIGNKQDYPDSIPAAPTGPVTVVARIQQSEPELPGRTAPKGEVATIDVPEIAHELGMPTYTGVYGLMAKETPAAAEGRPIGAVRPVLDEGLHLSYALQWIFFALMGFFGLGYALRQEFRIRNEENPDEMVRSERRRQKDIARPRTDAEIEDDLVDAAARETTRA